MRNGFRMFNDDIIIRQKNEYKPAEKYSSYQDEISHIVKLSFTLTVKCLETATSQSPKTLPTSALAYCIATNSATGQESIT